MVIQLLVLPINYFISLFSYKYVEELLRYKMSKKKSLLIILAAGFATTVLILLLASGRFSWSATSMHLFTSEVTEFDMKPANFIPQPSCSDNTGLINPRINCLNYVAGATAKILVLGDSHSGHHLTALNEASKEIGYSLYSASMSEGLGIYGRDRQGISPINYDESNLEELQLNIKAIKDFLTPGDILIYSTFTNRAYSNRESYKDYFREGLVNIKTSKVDSIEQKVETSINRLSSFLSEQKFVSKIFVIDNPTFNLSPETCYYRIDRCRVSLETINRIKTGERDFFYGLKQNIPSIYLFDAFNPFCDDSQCSMFDSENRLLYHDNNHLNKRGSLVLLDDWVELFGKVIP